MSDSPRGERPVIVQAMPKRHSMYRRNHPDFGPVGGDMEWRAGQMSPLRLNLEEEQAEQSART